MKMPQVLIICLLLFGCSSEKSAENYITIEAIDGPIYEKEDSIMVKLTIHNNIIDNMIIYNWKHNNSITAAMDAFIIFNIAFEDGTKLKYDYLGAIPKMPHSADTLHITQGLSYTEIININKYYGSGDKKDYLYFYSHYPVHRLKWPVGKYKISCIYEYILNPNCIGGKDLWEGKLESNEIEIEIR